MEFLFRWSTLIVLALLFVWAYNQPYDDTDNAETKERSGLRLYIDHGTGCHYISTGWFTTPRPRLDAYGEHICKGE